MNKFSIVPKNEISAVWSISPEVIRSAVVEAGVGKKLRFLKQSSRPRGKGEKISWDLIRNLRQIPVVISLDSALAYTAIVPFQINLQGKPREDRLEFQGVVREIVNRANLETRLGAAEALAVTDLDAVLFDARVAALTIDGKDVAGWPQIPGKKLTGAVNLTFVNRELFEELHALRHSRKEIYITEEDKAALSILERAIEGPWRVLRADPERAEILCLDYRHEPVFRKIPLNWKSPLTLLAEEWEISEAAARRILAARENSSISRAAEKLFARLDENSLENLNRALARTKLRGEIYYRGTDILPVDLPYTYERIELAPYPLNEILAELGFERTASKGEENILLPFLEYYYHRGDPSHHRALTRQIHWIAQ